MAELTEKSLSPADVQRWVAAYLQAWTSNDPADIAELFTPDAEYIETPYATRWIGRDAIVAGWRSRWEWQQGGWEFDWELSSITARTASITGVGTYARLGVFDNTWTVVLAADLRCSLFHMINTERDPA
jgi:hypothetical protein